MAIKKGLLYSTNNPDGLYPFSQTDCIFDDTTEQSLDGILSDLQTLVSSLSTNKQNALTVGNGIDITNNIISNQFEVLNGVDLNNLTYNFIGITRNTTNIPTGVNAIGKVIVIAPKGVLSNNPYITQIYIPANSDDIWYRRYQSSWRAWRKLSDCYMAGDVVSNVGSQYPTLLGLCTNTKQIEFVIPLSKPINATSVSFSNLTIRIWNTSGSVLVDSIDVVADTSYTVYSSIVANVGIKVQVVANTGIFPGTGIALPVNIRPGTSFTFA